MTDRHGGYMVILSQELRDEDAEEIMIALRNIRGVIKVLPHIDENLDMGYFRGKYKVLNKLRDLIEEELKI